MQESYPDNTAEKLTGNLPRLKSVIMHPRTKLNFDLDQEERAIVAKAYQMSREEVWECLEKKRYDDLKRKAVMLSGECIAKARCPICTL